MQGQSLLVRCGQLQSTHQELKKSGIAFRPDFQIHRLPNHETTRRVPFRASRVFVAILLATENA
jgi:hypothetical protein